MSSWFHPISSLGDLCLGKKVQASKTNLRTCDGAMYLEVNMPPDAAAKQVLKVIPGAARKSKKEV